MSIDKILAAIPGKSLAERAKLRANAERLAATGTPAQQAQAKAVLAELDRVAQMEAARLHAAVSMMDMAARVAAAFTKRPPTKTEEAVIRALLDNPHATSTELTRACGWDGLTWQMHFGAMARKREADLWPAEPFTRRDANFYSGILADFDPDGARFTMKPEVALALKALGIASRARKDGA
jgi:hypothetical protein